MNPFIGLMLGLLIVILLVTLPTLIQRHKQKPNRTWVTKHIEGRGGKFYFWDEAGLYSYGPFATFDECERELKKTVKYAGTKEYLGDSVYALFDGYNMTLYLDNGYGPKHEIFLEPEAMNAFLNFVERLEYKQDKES